MPTDLPAAFARLPRERLLAAAEFIEPSARDWPGRVDFHIGQLIYMRTRREDIDPARHIADCSFRSDARTGFEWEAADFRDSVLALVHARGMGR